MLASIFGIIDAILGFFVRDAVKKAALSAKVAKALGQVNAGANDSVNISTEYDRICAEQDARLDAEAAAKKLETPPKS